MYAALTDPEWAIPINTALLILLTIVNFWHNRRTARRTDNVHSEVVDVKRAVGVNRREHDEEAKPVNPQDTADFPARRWTDPEDVVQ